MTQTTTPFSRYQKLVGDARTLVTDETKDVGVRIQIGSATCENAAGARDVHDEMLKHIRASGRADIELHRTGCTGRCSREPIVGVFVPGQMPVKYEQVDRQRAHQIFTQHVLGRRSGARANARQR
jgi:(2Fe-2S) ferredoxin